MKYRDLKPDELVEEGDEFQTIGYSDWLPSYNWRRQCRRQSKRLRYRRPIKDTIQDRLQSLAVEMHSIALLMLADDQSTRMQAKGVELQGASTMVHEWLKSMADEQTIRTFVEWRTDAK